MILLKKNGGYLSVGLGFRVKGYDLFFKLEIFWVWV
jgi:hypothetical protein